MIKVRVEKKEDGLVMGRMIGFEWHYSHIPEEVSGMKIAFETWFAQNMETHQPGVEYEIEYQDGVFA